MRLIKLISIIFLTGLSLAAFAGGSAETSEASGPVPAWVKQTPPSADGKTFFVASGSSEQGDQDQANQAAALDLINQINRYLGVSITSESIATEVSSANDYQAKIVGMVKQIASGDIAGMRVADRYSKKAKQKITVFVLGEYLTIDLEKEKAKRAALVREAEDAVAQPEARGGSLENSGQVYDALRYYLEAATAAAGGKVRNSEVKFERNIQNSLRSLSRLQLQKVSAPTAALARKAVEQDFTVAVSDVKTNSPIIGADLAVGYREYQDNGKFRQKSQIVKTDSQGQVHFKLPTPVAVGQEKISFALDISAYLHGVESLTGREKSLVDGVLDAAGGKRLVFDLQVQSAARSASISALVLETDETGNALTNNRTAQAIMQKLSSSGFKVANPAVSSNFLVEKSDQEIQALLKDATGGKSERLVYGTAKIQSIDDRGPDGVFVKVVADMFALEVKGANLLLSFNQVTNARGENKAQAINAAFTKLGQDIGEKLARDLP